MAAVSAADVIKLTKRENISGTDGSLPTDDTVGYDLIKALDFPMEDIPDGVEDEQGHENSRYLEPPATPPSFDASFRPTIFNDNDDMKFKKPSTLYEQTSQITQFPSVAAKSKLASSAISNTQFFPSTSSNSSPSENLYRWDASESDYEASLTEEMSNPVKRKQKKKRNLSQLLSQLSGEEMTKLSSEELGESRETKRCTHCAVTKTPQWREGPQGPKTLCNACGVRYRSGRLSADYRPAASPMFSSVEPAESRETKRCMHCSVTRTSQWREGSQGPKTLCNACGVRYRSGCLFPEYRPAASPTFSSDKPHESLETKRCMQCAVTKTRHWREGPLGPKTLCNACGVRYRSHHLFPPYRPAASPTIFSKEAGASRETKQKQCTHCAVSKTPQWREGPQGRMTLCNACGVRYRSGRLFPEYRPAASPTFIASEHSNSHKKVIELRNKGCQGATVEI